MNEYKGNTLCCLFVGLCPLLAAASCAANGLTLGALFLLILLVSGIFIALTNRVLPEVAKIPAKILIVCGITAVAQLLIRLCLPEIAEALGIFVPLCSVAACLCFVGNSCESCSIVYGLKCGLASLVLLTLVGIVREFLSSGSVFGIGNIGSLTQLAAFPVAAFILAGVLIGICAAIMNHKKGDAK